ncbi:MAG: metallophosphoesterase family protein [Pirellula sp.]
MNSIRTDLAPNVLILGGDITGKRVILSCREKSKYVVVVGDKLEVVATTEAEFAKFKIAVEDQGSYLHECTLLQARTLAYDAAKMQQLAEQLMKKRVQEWCSIAERKLENTNVQLIINTGNDDPYSVDDVLKHCKRVKFPEGMVVKLGCSVALVSVGYSNTTPWRCHRECDEVTLKGKIVRAMSNHDGQDKLIFNFHCPPKGTFLDQAVLVDPATLKPIVNAFGPVTGHVGSTAVREAIERFKPIVALHGHIHDIHASEKIGTTICFNPGSDYRSGILRGVFLEFDQTGELQMARLTEEGSNTEGDLSGGTLLRTIMLSVPILKNFVHADFEDKVEHRLDKIESTLRKIERDLERNSSKPTDSGDN